ncbi:MAG TPA: type VI secretion system tube protein Hcp [Dehalococcoidia bacterium]|nr:type VI secretion system tube protein Hcp [Dehalococcoidia bacterium]
MKKPLKGKLPKIALLLVALLLTLTMLAACDAFGTKAPEEEGNGDEPPTTEQLPGDDDFVTENGGAPLGSPGSYAIFVEITGISGESTDDAHDGWIEVLSYSHGVSQAGSGTTGDRTTERADHLDFTVVKELDKASPKLSLYCCNGTHIEEVTIELCRVDGDKDKFMEYVLTDVIVTSVIINGSAGSEDRPIEEVSFAYGRIDWTYTEYDEFGMPMGNVETYWDVELAKGG